MIYRLIVYSTFFLFSCFNLNSISNINYYTFYDGNIPVILIVSHDGSLIINDIPTRTDSTDKFNIKNDLNTGIITKDIYSNILNSHHKKPYILINDVHRKYVDMNRFYKYAYEEELSKDIYNDFHDILKNKIQSVLDIYGNVYVFDIHGFSKNNLDIVISTRKHTTVNVKTLDHLLYSSNSFKNNLSKNNFNVNINDPFYGGYIIKTIFDNFGNSKVSAMQVELGKEIRFNKLKQQLFIKIFSEYILSIGNSNNV